MRGAIKIALVPLPLDISPLEGVELGRKNFIQPSPFGS
jgi:hypothetical protein